ncbi:MAG: hypothetical protein IRZ31_08835 [Thermogemmatispora sp.]|nr:hypothetical protein [Thermogemmatispora sp.]MBX5456993.1 hypothetical protein [Thermogemmatispora sp.]
MRRGDGDPSRLWLANYWATAGGHDYGYNPLLLLLPGELLAAPECMSE